MLPRSVHAAASRTMRSFSAAEKLLRLPGAGWLSTEGAFGGVAAEGTVVDWSRNWEGFGTGLGPVSALTTH